ncbi:MAG: DUF5753 domain-containing protein, partial [Pseudonocardia sp.]|nr:DUF5753 domain-containing protein [Pseudonocardia sp.]
MQDDARTELGRVGLEERDVGDLLARYGAVQGDDLAEFLALARRANEPGWWQRYHDLLPGWAETCIRSYDVQFVPGLLQTADYAREVTRLGHDDAREVDRLVERRIRRQSV